MSKKRHQEVNPVTGHPVGTDTEVVRPDVIAALRPLIEVRAAQLGADVDEQSLAAAEAYVNEEVSAVTPEPQSAKVLERTTPQVKQMVEQQPAKLEVFEQRVYRCVYDDAATARKVLQRERDPDVFCQVCGNRMVRER